VLIMRGQAKFFKRGSSAPSNRREWLDKLLDLNFCSVKESTFIFI